MDQDTIMLGVNGKFHAFALSTAIRARIEDLKLNPDSAVLGDASVEIEALNEIGVCLSECIKQKAALERKVKMKPRKNLKQSMAYRTHILKVD